jgi:hypothetical protein
VEENNSEITVDISAPLHQLVGHHSRYGIQEKIGSMSKLHNLEDKVDLEGVGNDRISRIRNINVVTHLVLEGSMTHLNL